jgi:small GTP-binding protein
VIKLIVVGDASTGKTSIIKRYVDNYFSEEHKATVGVDFAVKHLNVNGTEVRLQLWDIAGQERFGASSSKVYYRDSLGALLVYDISRPLTFDTVTKWKEEIDTMVRLPDGEGPIPVVLIGNKCDVESGGGQVDQSHLDRFCEERGFLKWFDTSAASGEGIDEAMNCVVEKILSYPNIFSRKREKHAVFKPELHNNFSNAGCC